ncbi:MAG: hypothetical protein M3071_05880 [Actinomycetota bacterium]|nr:hypothetical protein [Actinomycetota bacterium]
MVALLGERDDRATTVGSVAAALDPAGILEAAQDRDEIGGIDAEQLDERLLGRGPPLAGRNVILVVGHQNSGCKVPANREACSPRR